MEWIEPTREQWAISDFWFYMEKDWEKELPSIDQRMRCFPKEYKVWLKQLLQELLDRRRLLVNGSISLDWRQILLDKNEAQRAETYKKLKMLTYKPKEGELDIPRARAYPITDLLEFNRAKKTLCLWHNDKHPSLSYNPKTNKVKCFSCNMWADSIDICMKLNNLTFKEAVGVLCS